MFEIFSIGPRATLTDFCSANITVYQYQQTGMQKLLV